MLVGLETGDDAAVVRVAPELGVVHTLDFFMPIVDSARDFGRIAAANSLSDVYAMGGTPISALAILGIPTSKLPVEIAAEILAGGAEVCKAAGVSIVGGHSIDDAEPKFGLAVLGLVHPDRILRNSGGQAGDLLVLTKPLGSGALTTALKRGALSEAELAPVIEVMATLNRAPAQAALEVGVHAATDVTGFGLLGHARGMAKGAGLALELWVDRLPLLPGARETVAAGISPGATRRNLDAYASVTTWEPGLDDVDRKLVADPQTSGGLLLAVPEARVGQLVAALRAHGALASAVVGRLLPGEGVSVRARAPEGAP